VLDGPRKLEISVQFSGGSLLSMAQRAPRAHPYPRKLAQSQIEIYFSIVQRKVLTPNDFKSLNELEQRLLAFQQRYEETVSPFQWTFTRKDLTTLLAKIENKRLAS